MYEIEPLIKSMQEMDKTGWEQTRLISYVMAQCNSSKKLKPTDIIKFSWDNQDYDTAISNEDIQRLKEKAKQFINKQ